MQSFFIFIINLIFPPKCVLCNVFGSDCCIDCLSKLSSHVVQEELQCYRQISLWNYDSFGISKMIKAWKYSYKHQLLERLLEPSECLDFSTYDYFVSVPMHKRRQVERGANHVDAIVKTIDAEKQLKGLKRVKNTRQQAKLSKAERRLNLKGAFTYTGPSLENKHILLFDDVVSTGETVSGCREVLIKAGAKQVDIFCLAVNKQKTA